MINNDSQILIKAEQMAKEKNLTFKTFVRCKTHIYWNIYKQNNLIIDDLTINEFIEFVNNH